MTEPKPKTKCDRWPEEYTEEYMMMKGKQGEEDFRREHENQPIIKCGRCGDTGWYAAYDYDREQHSSAYCNALPTCTAARDKDKEADDGEGKE